MAIPGRVAQTRAVLQRAHKTNSLALLQPLTVEDLMEAQRWLTPDSQFPWYTLLLQEIDRRQRQNVSPTPPITYVYIPQDSIDAVANKKIRALAIEINKCFEAGAPNGASLLIRSVIERLADDYGRSHGLYAILEDGLERALSRCISGEMQHLSKSIRNSLRRILHDTKLLADGVAHDPVFVISDDDLEIARGPLSLLLKSKVEVPSGAKPMSIKAKSKTQQGPPVSLACKLEPGGSTSGPSGTSHTIYVYLLYRNHRDQMVEHPYVKIEPRLPHALDPNGVDGNGNVGLTPVTGSPQEFQGGPAEVVQGGGVRKIHRIKITLQEPALATEDVGIDYIIGAKGMSLRKDSLLVKGVDVTQLANAMNPRATPGSTTPAPTGGTKTAGGPTRVTQTSDQKDKATIVRYAFRASPDVSVRFKTDSVLLRQLGLATFAYGPYGQGQPPLPFPAGVPEPGPQQAMFTWENKLATGSSNWRLVEQFRATRAGILMLDVLDDLQPANSSELNRPMVRLNMIVSYAYFMLVLGARFLYTHASEVVLDLGIHAAPDACLNPQPFMVGSMSPPIRRNADAPLQTTMAANIDGDLRQSIVPTAITEPAVQFLDGIANSFQTSGRQIAMVRPEEVIEKLTQLYQSIDFSSTAPWLPQQ